jgi:hypothetical protein
MAKDRVFAGVEDSEGIPKQVTLGIGKTPGDALFLVFPVVEADGIYVVEPASEAFKGLPDNPVELESVENLDALRSQAHVALARWADANPFMRTVTHVEGFSNYPTNLFKPE